MDFTDCSYAFQELTKAVAQGVVPSDVERVFRKLVFGDKMIPQIGNKYAFEEFLSKEKPGLYCVVDINSFKKVNDLFGHEIGDEVIILLGKTLRAACVSYYKNTGNRCKLFRIGGDEFVVYLESPKNYEFFFQHLHSYIFKLSLVKNKYRISISLGCGPNYSTADSFLLKAKILKKKHFEDHSNLILSPNVFVGQVLLTNQQVSHVELVVE